MGCAISKRALSDRRCPPGSPLARSQSLPLDCKPSAVGLASSTLGSLKLDQDSAVAAEEAKKSAEKVVAEGKTDHSTRIAKDKVWSEKMGKRIPKTTRERQPTEPEGIDASLLVAGLEEAAATRFSVTAVVDRHSFSFHPIHDSQTVLESVQITTIWSAGVIFQSPLWKPAAAKIDENGVGAADFDPEVLSAFRKPWTNSGHSTPACSGRWTRALFPSKNGSIPRRPIRSHAGPRSRERWCSTSPVSAA